ncbi:MAG: ATP-binding protein [Aquabacterium sp.]|nr:ATP-binding protein [Aquabacterium sp.]
MPDRAAAAAKTGATGWSLERRLRRRLLVALIVLWLLGGALALAGMRHETAAILDSGLAEVAQRLLVLPREALGGRRHGHEHDPDEVAVRSAEVGEHEERVIYQVFDHEGRLRLRSHQAPLAPLARQTGDGYFEQDGWRIYALTRDDGRRRVLVAQSLADRHAALARVGGWMLGPLLALLPLAAWALQWVLARALGALQPLQRDLAGRAATELQPVRADAAPEELQPLVQTLNALLGRVRELLEAERLFAARSAHELRTPLAAARAQAQRLAVETNDAAARERAHRLVAQLDRLTALATRLLQLARIESGVALAREPVDLAQLAQLVVDEFGAPDQRSRITVDVPPKPCSVEGDVDALAIAMRNLVDNALKHAGPTARVAVRVGPRAIEVCDDGPGLDVDAVTRLKRPFERGAQPGADGSGLGLAMVETIARQAGARFELEPASPDGRGLCARLRFD